MKKITITIVLLGIIALAGVIILQKTSFLRTEQKTIIVNNSLIKLNKNQLVGLTDAIVLGAVENIQSFIQSSNSTPGEKEVYSNITLEISSYLYNTKSLTDKEITIQVFGGETPELKMLIAGEKPLKRNHQYVFFIKQKDNSKIFSAIGSQGIFEVSADEKIGVDENEKNLLKNIFGKELTVEELKNELVTAKPESLPDQK